jgi:cytochrome c oxidase subunit 2
MDSLDPVTRQGLSVTNLFGIELAISAVLFALVLGVLVISLVRFRAQPGEATEPAQVHGNRTIELVWTLTPALVLAGIFIAVVQTMRTVDAADPGSQRLRVVGHQWWWEFEYPDLGVITANELVVPVGQPLSLDLQSIDVIHGFFVPHFGWMRDAVPGKTNHLSVLVDRAGQFDGACTQYCGAEHAWMRMRIIAEPADAFAAWAQQQRAPVPASSRPGEQVFRDHTCINCHAIRGLTPDVRVGPDLTHLASRQTLGGGVLSNTPDNLQRWIRDPGTVKPGVLMPAFQSLTPDDLQALVDYLESLI